MRARGVTPKFLFDQAAAPLGQDASGRYYLVRLADDPSSARLLKRFDHPGWRPANGRWHLMQQLWRLVRLGRPELPALTLEVAPPATGELVGAPPYACLLDAPGPRVLAERLPIAPAEALELLSGLVELVWSMHQARISGARFDASAIVPADPVTGAGWRWVAPDLVPPEGPFEAACRDDLQALAHFARRLVTPAGEELASPEADTPLGRAIASLTAPDLTATAALQQTIVHLGDQRPLPTLPAAPPTGSYESELETLGAWLRKCAQERRLHALWLASEPGTPVWDLCAALATRVRPAGMRVVVTHCQANHTPEAFLSAVVRQLEALRGHGGPRGPLAAELAGPPVTELPPALARLRLLTAFRRLLREVAERGPLCLAWLGFERADGLLRELVGFLRAQAEDLPVLLLLGHEAGAEAIVPAPEEDVLPLRLLFRPEIERLARAHCPGLSLGAPALDAAWRHGEGQPAALYRLCLHWLRGGGLREEADDHWVPRDDGPRVVPPELVREFLRGVATLGPIASLATLQALMDMPAGSFFELIEGALDGGWLRQEGAWLTFWRADEAHAFAEHLPAADALRWHRRLAAVAELPLATRAFHAARGGQEVMAIPLLIEAGCDALARGAVEAAMRQFELGLEIAEADDPRRIELIEGLAKGYLEAREPAQALALMVGELARAGSRDTAPGTTPASARLAVLQGRARAFLGDQPGARSAYERALPRLAPGDTATRVRVMLALAELAFNAGERERGDGFAAEALATARQANSPVLQAEALASVGRGVLAGPREGWSEGLAALREAVSLAMPAGQLEVAARAHGLAVAAYRAMDRLAGARESNQAYREVLAMLGRTDEREAADLEAAALAVQLGLFGEAAAELDAGDFEQVEASRPERWARASAIRAAASLQLGYLHDPLRLLDQALRTARGLGEEAIELAVLRHLIDALIFLGKHARAEEVCQNGLGLAAALGDRGAELWLRADLAEIAWWQDDLERALRLFQRVEAEAGELGLVATRARALVGLGRLSYERDHFDEAAAAATAASRVLDGAAHPLLQTEILLLEGDLALARGDRASAAGAFEAALERAELLVSPYYQALAAYGLGHSVADPVRAGALSTRAAEQMGIYLDQLSDNGRRDFLARRERRRIAELRAPTAEVPHRPVMTSLPGTRSALRDLLEQEGTRQDSVAMLDEVLGLVAARLPLDRLILRMNEIFVRVSKATRGMVFLANEDGELKLRDTQAMVPGGGALAAIGPLSTVLDRVRRSGATVWVTDATRDPIYADLLEVQDLGLRGVLCIPLKVRDADDGTERVLGCLYGDRPIAWEGIGEKELGVLELMARYISVSLEIGVLQDESARKTHRLEMLNDLSRAMAGTLDLERLLSLALMQILKVSKGQQGYLFFGEDLKCRASLDQHGRVLTEIQVSRSVIDRVARERKPVAILDVGADEELQQKASLMIRNVRSVMCVPLLLDDRLVGLIYVSSSTANKTFTRNDLDLVTAIAAQIALALQNAQAFEIIKELNQSLERKVKARTTELEQAYRELQEAQAQLLETEKLATIGTLAGGVAHEINNPLGAVLTNAQLLMAELSDPDQLDSLHMIEEGARRCREIVSALLKYSRPPQASHQPVELRQVVAETVGLLDRQLQQDGIRLETAIDVEPTVMGDATELRQVVAHLMLNAIDAVREAGRAGDGCITVRLARELDGVTLAVTDNGVGMVPEVLRRVFDPFYTTKKVGSGTGLGLSVCQRVIDKHGGKLHVSSTPGEGSTFTIALPAA